MKAAIIERAEHISSDEGEERERLADVDDFEEDDWGVSRVRIREGDYDDEEEEGQGSEKKETEVSPICVLIGGPHLTNYAGEVTTQPRHRRSRCTFGKDLYRRPLCLWPNISCAPIKRQSRTPRQNWMYR
jgi:hypothetical protein